MHRAAVVAKSLAKTPMQRAAAVSVVAGLALYPIERYGYAQTMKGINLTLGIRKTPVETEMRDEDSVSTLTKITRSPYVRTIVGIYAPPSVARSVVEGCCVGALTLAPISRPVGVLLGVLGWMMVDSVIAIVRE